MKFGIIMILFILVSSNLFAQNTTEPDKLEKVFGTKANVNGNVIKFTFPRTDMNVTIDGQKIEPGLALTSWVAIMDMGSTSMVMGDLVLKESEVPEVEKKMVADNISITGIHNHIMGETPVVKYIHYMGTGNADVLAANIKDVISSTSTPMAQGEKDAPPMQTTDWSDVESIMGMKGQEKGDLLQYAIKRNDAITENGMEIPPSMGMAISINFQKTNSGAMTTGDFVLTANEIEPVIKALTNSGITVTALHNHMVDESPRVFFLHFWGNDDPKKLATGLKDALNSVNYSKQ